MIAAIETTGDACSVALIQDGSVCVLLHTALPRRHDGLLALQFERALETAGIGVEGLRAIAVSVGPGSYTGIRIGLSFSIGLAMAADLPVIRVPTLDAMAFGARRLCGLAGRERVIAAVPAGRNGLYAASYGILPDFAPLHAAVVIPPEKLRFLSDLPALVAGPGEALPPASPDGHLLPAVVPLSAVPVAEYGERLLGLGMAGDAAHIEPLYIADYKVGGGQDPPAGAPRQQ